ncbi:hypothetical protein AA310_04980 [Arthrobacter sp. YC-RL1]|uniref:hypothetical protein n=1 Tax=Arthrobacter sp. YC-RL1 TaxID=1652545 RepID=UPI00063D993D|nr:hypothetical protein [Arthrobacter sp. YC-RL1]ALQ31544.1 hypothetical protein ATC04_13940 [Arthrobacter sp. YC-RL1]KLI89978.1 hypothetical protein AA310_04980 [Arthrobacter sp. YC-RL1]
MRSGVVIFGVLGICLQALFGAFLMNDWAVTAASELPLEETVAEMRRAEQNYSKNGGIVFASLGVVLAMGWGFLVSQRRFIAANWAALASWGAIIALGAPAYFFFSFANMNSVGDTFYDWNSDAAFSLEEPLYVTSGIAALIAVIGLVEVLRRPSSN